MWPLIQSCLVILVAFVFQATIVPHMAISGAKPDVVLIVTALYGFTYGSRNGMLIGFFGGLLGDLLAGSYVGLGMASKSIVGFFAGLVQRTIFVENLLIPMFAIFVATWINEFIYVAFLFLFGEITPVEMLVSKIILPSAIYNAILTPFVYGAVRRFMVFKQGTPVTRIARKYD